jgi:lipoate-protein ligase A
MLIRSLAAAYLMARDAENMAVTARDGVTRIEVYRFDPPAVTAGRNAHVTAEEVARWCAYGHDFARRPTGGGILRHGDDLSFGVTLATGEADRMTPTAHFIARVAEAAAAALREEGIETEPAGTPVGQPLRCFASPVGPELLFRGGKILGLAARRIRGAVLVQGSLAVGRDPESDRRILGEGPAVSLDGTTFDAKSFCAGMASRLISE